MFLNMARTRMMRRDLDQGLQYKGVLLSGLISLLARQQELARRNGKSRVGRRGR